MTFLNEPLTNQSSGRLTAAADAKRYMKNTKLSNLNKSVKYLKDYHNDHLTLFKKMMNANDGNLFPLDIVASGVMKRSLNLISGFCLLIENHNLLCAAPLLRLQIDNVLRFSAAWLVENPHDFANKIMDGVPVKDLKDINNKKLTDTYLKKVLGKKHPWLQRVYEETSGFVHLSDKHIFTTIKPTSIDMTCNIEIKLDDDIPDEYLIEAIEAFIATTNILFEYIEGWIFTKDNPGELKAKS